jgi:hypothetical protein
LTLVSACRPERRVLTSVGERRLQVCTFHALKGSEKEPNFLTCFVFLIVFFSRFASAVFSFVYLIPNFSLSQSSPPFFFA